MNNGVNNSEVTIEAVNNTTTPTTQPAPQPVTTPAAPTPVATPQPVETTATPQPEPTPQPTETQPTTPAQPEEKKEENSLGSNVKIAPVQPMYDENGKVIEQPEEKKPEPPRPEIVQPTPTPPGEPPQIQIKEEEPKQEEQKQETQEESKPKRRLSLSPLFLIIIIGLIGALVYVNNDKTNTINQLKYENIVIDTNNQKVELDKNSTIVQDLYNNVATTVKEDIANPNLDDEMKRYLAYRQITANKMYESHCNLFDQNKIYNYTCDNKTFKPRTFKEETLQVEIKKMFGENSRVEMGNIQLGRHCIGGFEYIPERGEFVEGQCLENTAVTIDVKKEITAAYRINDEIYIEEETRYISGNKGDIPEILKDGIYTYTFKLDTNLNYAYINKSYRTKY